MGIVTLSLTRKITYIGVVGNPMANFSKNFTSMAAKKKAAKKKVAKKKTAKKRA